MLKNENRPFPLSFCLFWKDSSSTQKHLPCSNYSFSCGFIFHELFDKTNIKIQGKFREKKINTN
jgi:hypothetical protein